MEKNSPAEQQHKIPQTLLEAVRYFADEDVAHSFAASLRWPDGPECPRCGCREYSYLKTRKLWKCKDRNCRYQYSLKVNTIFEDSPLGFDKWLPAVWLIVNCKNGVSSHELGRALGIHQESAWHLLGRIRLALELGSFDKQLSGEIETDESYVGGLAKHMHRSRRAKIDGKRGYAELKTPVLGIKQRDGQMVAKVIPQKRLKRTVHDEIHRHVERGATLYSDSNFAYTGLEQDYDHHVIDHSRTYVDGRISTNQVENFWALLKRCLKGTYVSVEPEHLHRYVSEEVFRFNARKDNDGARFASVLGRVEGKRLTYQELAGKED